MDGGYNGGHGGGTVAITHAFSKVCCTCFPSELYCVFIEILIFRGTVVAALCKIMNSEATSEEKASRLII